ncbi:ribonuclease H-like [Heterodontus francisci]|uniref:ribonuclease H-like n=1 Tax=Heterodontus francisci TaxID=7792 RepID=UPI00355B4163
MGTESKGAKGKEEPHLKIFVDGSSSGQDGERRTGCGIYVEDEHGQEKFSAALKLSQTMSAQAAELAAVAYVVGHPEYFPPGSVIYSDSMYVCNSLTEHLPLWEARGFVSADRKPLPSAPLLRYIFEGAQGKGYGITKVKAHSKLAPEGNRKADELAKQGAVSGQEWKPPIEDIGEQKGKQVKVMDLTAEQKKDGELKKLIEGVESDT